MFLSLNTLFQGRPLSAKIKGWPQPPFHLTKPNSMKKTYSLLFLVAYIQIYVIYTLSYLNDR